MPTRFKLPASEDEPAINRGIAADPDNPELHEAAFAAMQPARVMVSAIVAAHVRRKRGPQKRPIKELISLRLDREAVEALRASGAGWQRRAGEMLRKALLAE